MNTGELMAVGRKEIAETDETLVRAQRIVANTIEVGTKTAETLQGQTQQMERVLDDLDEIKFTLKKASKVIRDITRSMATDKYGLASEQPWLCQPFQFHYTGLLATASRLS